MQPLRCMHMIGGRSEFGLEHTAKPANRFAPKLQSGLDLTRWRADMNCEIRRRRRCKHSHDVLIQQGRLTKENRRNRLHVSLIENHNVSAVASIAPGCRKAD